VGTLLDQAQEFIEKVYLPDLMAVATFYKNWGTISGGLPNYLAYGDLPAEGYGDPSKFKFPRGAILNQNLNEVIPVDGKDVEQAQEFITHSWYEYSDGDQVGKHPWIGETQLRYSGPKPPYDFLDVEKKYSWLKTPRWKGHPVEVGPLARLLVAHVSGRDEVKEEVNGALKQLNVPLAALFSTLGRTAVRGLETRLVARWAKEFYGDLLAHIKKGDTRTFNNEKWNPKTWLPEAKGVGLSEAPRGALAHWIVIKDKKIANYQLVVPSTWNASPRDSQNQMSAYEASLIGTPVANPEQPLELLRTIHSFDPCSACAVHLYDEKQRYVHHINTA
jgi:hydrogenase large subunit